MDITVVSATGTGKTLLSAFDGALRGAGVYNFNLIALSSVIPVGGKIVRKKAYVPPKNVFGHRLYVVMADIRSRQSEKTIAAGLGWYMLKNGGGVFVEHVKEGDTKRAVEEQLRYTIHASLQDLVEARGEKFSVKKAGVSMATAEVDAHPRCALAIAVYKTEPW